MREVVEYLRFFSSLGVTHINLEPADAPVSPPSPTDGANGLAAIREEIGDCRRCKLSGGRTHIVFGSGDPKAELMFIGEAPGADEDLQGLPFVGKAGQLLTKIIEAIGLCREQVYIANILKCRPPENRDPQPDEVDACRGFLLRQIETVAPLVIVALGKHAAQNLLNSETPISRLRGKFCQAHGRLVMATFHPSYLLRNPGAKREVWEDMKAVREKLKALNSRYY